MPALLPLDAPPAASAVFAKLLCCSLFSLIDVDAKILAAVLANRLQQVISFVIKNDQAEFISAREAGDNIRPGCRFNRLKIKQRSIGDFYH